MRNPILTQACLWVIWATFVNSSPVALGKRRTMEFDDVPDGPSWDKRQLFSPRKTGVSTVTVAPMTKSITSTTIVLATATTTVTTIVIRTATVTVGAPVGGLLTPTGTRTSLTPASKTTYTAAVSPVPTSTNAVFLSSRFTCRTILYYNQFRVGTDSVITGFHPGLGSCGQVDNDS